MTAMMDAGFADSIRDLIESSYQARVLHVVVSPDPLGTGETTVTIRLAARTPMAAGDTGRGVLITGATNYSGKAALSGIGTLSGRASFTCPRCGITSPNPNDIREGYCGACHDWTGDDEELYDDVPDDGFLFGEDPPAR